MQSSTASASDMDTIMRRQGKFHNLLSQDSCPENIYDTGLLFFIFFGIFFINMRLIYVRKNKSADIKEAESIWWQKDLVNCG